MDIHQFAVVHPDAKIGENVKIGPFVTIDANVEIGDGTIIDSGAVVRSGARIGKNCHIHSNAVVCDIPQDLKFQGEDTVAIVGDNTVIREFVTIHRGTASRGKTVVGNHVIMSNSAQLAGEVEVADYAIIGGGALVHQFTHIGCHVMIQGGALVNKDIPPYCMAARYPIAYEGVNKVGLHRRGYSSEQIDAIADVYRTIYDSGLNVTQSLEEAAKLPASPERDIIIDFVRASKRGIVRKP